MINLFKKQNIILFILFIISIITIFSPKILAEENNDLVYLKVSDVKVSGFDDTPDWAPPQNALAPVDGDLNSRWASKPKLDNQWIYFDFGKEKILSKIKIRWERAYPIEYKIYKSNDALTWDEIKDIKNSKGGIEEIDFELIASRYIKIEGIKRINPEWGFSIWEVEFYGPKGKNPSDKSVGEVYPSLRVNQENTFLKMEPPVKSPGPIIKEEFQKGIVYTSWGRYELGSKSSDLTLEMLKQKGINAVAIMILYLQDTVDSKVVYADSNDTASDETLVHAINKAHSLGLKVMLKPHVDVKEGDWRGDIIPSSEWFKSYTDFIMKYAKISQDYNVELYCIGTELLNTTVTGQWDLNWRALIKAIKDVYKGKITYAANWNEYSNVNFWDEVDFIGIDAYFPLTSKNNPTKEELVIAWKNYADSLDAWLKKKNLTLPIIFSEIGYSSCDGTNKQPYYDFKSYGLDKVDQDEQADCLDAMLIVLKDRQWFRGMYWWQYFPTERYNPLGWIINGKKAEGVLFDWYSKLGKE
ncbi:MAG: discoidin domain-containing protein [Candidatus Omnitrophota bacterium]